MATHTIPKIAKRKRPLCGNPACKKRYDALGKIALAVDDADDGDDLVRAIAKILKPLGK